MAAFPTDDGMPGTDHLVVAYRTRGTAVGVGFDSVTSHGLPCVRFSASPRDVTISYPQEAET